MRVHVKLNDGEQWGGLRGTEWHVWVSLDHCDTDELEGAGEAFIIAHGDTREQALLNGWDVLSSAAGIAEKLQRKPRTSSMETS